MPGVKVANFFGGVDIKKNRETLQKEPISIVVGTPGRIKQVRTGTWRELLCFLAVVSALGWDVWANSFVELSSLSTCRRAAPSDHCLNLRIAA